MSKKQLRQIVEDSASAASLHPKSMNHDDLQIIDQHIQQIMKLQTNQRNRHLNAVQAMLNSAWREPGAGVPEGTAERNRRFNKEEIDIEKFDNELNNCLEEMGFNEETKQKASHLFFEAVEARLFHEDDEFRQKLLELLADTCPSLFISDFEIDACEVLAKRIEELEAAVEYVGSENARLEEEIRAEADDYRADLAEHEARFNKSPKRSSLDALLEADSENEDALFNEQRQHQYIDPEMKNYL
jgi:hypothetical protein